MTRIKLLCDYSFTNFNIISYALFLLIGFFVFDLIFSVYPLYKKYYDIISNILIALEFFNIYDTLYQINTINTCKYHKSYI